MKTNKKIFLLLLFLICILSTQVISATENTTNKEVISANTNENNLEINNQYDEIKENSKLNSEENNHDNKDKSRTDKITTENKQPLSFKDLNKTVNGNSNSTIYLSNNYKYNEDSDSSLQQGIIINRDLTIYGNGITIDGNKMANMFNLTDINLNVKFYNINFINGNSTDTEGSCGGALQGGNAYNCTFINNYADLAGGAIYMGNAYNCTFINNYAGFTGGAIEEGNAYNCTFINNYADFAGGAMMMSNAYNCTFTNNTALSAGGAMSLGEAVLCRFNGDSVDLTEIIPATINVLNYTSTCQSGEILKFNLTVRDTNWDGFNTTIRIYKDGSLISTFYGLSGEGWVVDLEYGEYTAELCLPDYCGVIPTNVTINIVKSSFTLLNKAINGNKNSKIYLLKNNYYKYDDTSDEAFRNGIIINRNLTIYGNGATIDGGSVARIFKVEDNTNVKFYNMNFINGHREDFGGAIYQGNAYNCTFTNNNAEKGGAIYQGNAYNCTFINNNAEKGGAIYQGNGTNCTFTGNAAENGGAIYCGDAYNCIFTENYVQFDGGAINSGNAYNCTFTKNKADDDGGAINQGKATKCTFIGNVAKHGGAMDRSNAYNCIFTENLAHKGGAIIYSNASNCTFTNNYGDDESGAICQSIAILCRLNGDTISNTTIIPTTINVINYTSTYGSGKMLKFNLTANDTVLDGINTTINIYKDDALVKTVYGLTGEGWIVDLNPGTYTAELSLTDYPEEQPSNATIIVSNESSEITASPVTTTYNINKNLIITLKNAHGNPITNEELTVNLGSAKKYKTNKNGQVKINVATLTPKTYNAKITYKGSDSIKGSTASVKITVKKATPKITAKTANYKLKIKTKKYTTSFKDNKNQALKNTKVSLKINGKTYTVKTNNKGQATFKITNLNKKGTYTAVITYPANKYYNKVSKKVKITIKP